MMTTEQLFDMMKRLPESELERLKQRLEELLRDKKTRPAKRGEKLMALAGSFDLGECLIANPDREMLYRVR